MKRFLISAIFLSVLHLSVFSQWQVSGGLYPVYNYTPSLSSGLDNLSILYGMNGVRLAYISSLDSPAKCYRYATNALYPEEVSFVQNGNEIVFTDPTAGYGYFLEQEGRRISYMWLIDYEKNALVLNQLAVIPDMSDCSSVRLALDRAAPNLYYYTINGRQESIDRELTLTYQTLAWNEESLGFETAEKSETVRSNSELTAETPFCNTSFGISGDQFLRFWNIPQSVESDVYEAVAVTGEAFATQTVRDAGNELDKETGELGGSAPVEIEFSGYSNYPVATYQAWEISKDAEFGIIEATYTDRDLNYSFEEEGTMYVRFVVSNAENTCENTVKTFTVEVSESSLQVPNVFTPGSSSGNNLLFKVAYRSIIKFEGRVFNRWGNELFHWTDPAEGWDGTYHGKLVPTGAYFYVIKAEGVGGKKYDLKGDINVLRTKNK